MMTKLKSKLVKILQRPYSPAISARSFHIIPRLAAVEWQVLLPGEKGSKNIETGF